MRVIYLMILSTLFLFSCGNEGDNNSVEEQFTIKEKSENLNEAEIRLMELDSIIDADEKNIQALLEKGAICKDNLDFKCALNVGAKAFKIDSTNLEARKLYAWTLINKPNPPLDDIDRAKRHYKYVLSEDQKNPDLMVELANTYALTGDFEPAFKYINDALRIDDKHRDAYVLKGSIYKTIDNLDIALSSYQTAIQIDPDYFLGHLEIGYLYSDMREPKLALEYYENAAELDPESLNAWYGVAMSYQELGDFEEAQSAYRELLNVNPNFYIAYMNQGVIHHEYLNDLDSAVYYYNKAIDVEPEAVRAWHNLGAAYLDQGREVDAARAFNEVLGLNPDYEPTLILKEQIRNK